MSAAVHNEPPPERSRPTASRQALAQYREEQRTKPRTGNPLGDYDPTAVERMTANLSPGHVYVKHCECPMHRAPEEAA
ncbi:hypothetical protein [Kitasatospora sp. NBC_01266]|uniref:hypothetical protein n=1 Tax=Kitasatospora sp. NBC_01266 TaxID=2903572 RepID=UPI002E32FEE1|nr:hypothetical protein [Kitasatospora sp. NBC_01266]